MPLINHDIAYMDYGETDPYVLGLQKLNSQMNASQDFSTNKLKMKSSYSRSDSPGSDPAESYRSQGSETKVTYKFVLEVSN